MASPWDGLFRRLADREMILPYFEQAMLSDTWPDAYTVRVDSSPYYGAGDGYFHPSSHPLMGARQLYYMFHPETRDQVIKERRNLQSHMTLAMGSALHGIVQAQFQIAGLIADSKDIEVEYVNHQHHVRGRADFIVDHPQGERLLVELKSLACSTPILTTRGWTTMGDLRDGDEVYAPDGQPTKVLKAHPINLNRPCYEVAFRDGQKVVTDAEHLWAVNDRSSGGRDRVMTTKEIADAKWSGTYRFRVPVTDPLQLPEQNLPIDPWLLGMWLGDGDTTTTSITSGDKDLPYLRERLERLGIDFTESRSPGRASRLYLKGVRDRFCELGLFGKNPTVRKVQGKCWGNKHIPEQYLLASEDQRRELLAGLMDSDGTVGDHQAAICMVNEPLMRQVLQLVRSLGYRATWNESRAKLNGKDCGPVYWVKFSTSWGPSPFAMPRKKTAWEGKPKGSVQNLRLNAIVSVSEVDTVPVRCITVAHESSLYVAGVGFVPTHNTQNSYGFRKQDGIKPSWDAQLSLALDNLGIETGVLMVLESGWPYQLKEFLVRKNQPLLDEIYAKFDYVRECIDRDSPPQHCCAFDSPEMKKCPARGLCWLAERPQVQGGPRWPSNVKIV